MSHLTPQSLQQQKQSIRSKVRAQRQKVEPSEAQEAGAILCQNFLKLPKAANAQTIACYFSFDGEIPTQPIIDTLIAAQKICCFPKLRPYKPNRLWFLPYTGKEPLLLNRYGIPEVDLSVNHALALSSIDILMMPLVAFDCSGNRLGMGGGYYDATLTHLNRRAARSVRPLCIGLAYEFQRMDSIPKQLWDYPLDGVLTEGGFYDFTRVSVS